MKRLTTLDERVDAARRLAEILDARVEWFCMGAPDEESVPVGRGEWELKAAHGALHFSYRTKRGHARVWRVEGWEWTGERLRLEATRRAGAERAVLELVPRATVREGTETLAAARRAACARLASLVREAAGNAEVERASLSAGARRGVPGRYARINLRSGRESIAATGAVVSLGAHEVDAFLASALLWWPRAGERGKSGRASSARSLWLVVSDELKDAVAERLALLGASVRREIKLWAMDETGQILSQLAPPTLAETFADAPRARRPPPAPLSETAARIIALAPEAIDAVRARHGETLRFHGLTFARVRRWMGRERVWFGATRPTRLLLDEDTLPQFSKLIDELRAHRRAAAVDQRHALYAAAPEAWLESLLRRDITRLDPGLRLAPLHAQFRTFARNARNNAARPVDLLALRRDGRLVVVELKIAEDAALPLQGADYWRRVEAHRRRGDIERTRLFGDAHIADAPPLLYLVAPFLRFHRHFDALARMLSSDIDLYRFDLNEDWRMALRVLRRTRLTAER
ncbi:MAG TPA: hypothetical protein VF656_00790 [Pyrinomonadaceae bacterium]|jgi:hypothetical protein